MNRLFVLISIVWILPVSLIAQDAPKVELFVGYPHLQGENSGQIFAATEPPQGMRSAAPLGDQPGQ